MSISKETLHIEPMRALNLGAKRRGELAELAFMRKAADLGFAVAKPWGESDRYDVVVRIGKVFWRVQVKSVLAKTPARSYFRVRTVNWLKLPYNPDEIDFLVAYIFPADTWYIFPATIVENRTSVCVMPGSKRSKYDQYREAWGLLGYTAVAQKITEAAAPV